MLVEILRTNDDD